MDSGIPKRVAISTSIMDDAWETRAFAYLSGIISCPTRLSSPAPSAKHPMLIAATASASAYSILPIVAATRPIVFAPRVKAAKKDAATSAARMPARELQILFLKSMFGMTSMETKAARREIVAAAIQNSITKAIYPAIKLLHKMHGTDEIRKLKGLRHRVKALENDGDVIKDAMLDFAYSSKAGFKDFYFIIDAAYLSDDILDSCEDASDIFISIMTSIIT